MKKIYSICVAVFILTSTFGGSVEAQKVFGECNNKQCRESISQLETSNLAAEESQVIKLVNSQRAKYGLAPLKANTQLINIARVKSRDMMMKNYFSHTSPTFGSTFSLLTRYGLSYAAAGENIAYGYNNAASVMNGWMNSPGHRANILGRQYREIGVGAARSRSGKIYWTQVFIKR
ncbi:transporter [Clostridium acetobutylicum]|nr:transporter [Clostridium acetobutylicum]